MWQGQDESPTEIVKEPSSRAMVPRSCQGGKNPGYAAQASWTLITLVSSLLQYSHKCVAVTMIRNQK